jgi:hypothetical protein
VRLEEPPVKSPAQRRMHTDVLEANERKIGPMKYRAEISSPVRLNPWFVWIGRLRYSLQVT